MSFVLKKRFLPLFLTQFFGASNDNFLKNAMLIMVTYQLGETEAAIGGISNLAAALFILPYFLFSTLAGQFADKFDRSRYSQVVKIVEIVLMVTAGIGFLLKSLPILMTVLFFMGAQSTFFSPAKYSLLPTHLRKEELVGGNAWINGGTYIAILSGAIGGGLTITLPNGNLWCGTILLLCAFLGYFASRRIPPAPSADPGLKIDWNFFRQTGQILKNDIWRQVPVRYCVFSVAMFWLAGSLYITQLPLFTKIYVGGNEAVCTGFFVLFSVGVGIGSAIAGFVFKKKIRLGVLLFSMAAMGLLTFELAVIVWTGTPCKGTLPWNDLLHSFLFYQTALTLFFLAVFGGMWSVPLNAVMQSSSKKEVLSRVIAGNNIVNSFYMAGGAVLVAGLMHAGVDSGWIFAGLGVGLILNIHPILRLGKWLRSAPSD